MTQTLTREALDAAFQKARESGTHPTVMVMSQGMYDIYEWKMRVINIFPYGMMDTVVAPRLTKFLRWNRRRKMMRHED